MGLLIELTNAGKKDRENACRYLQKAIDSLTEVQTVLKKQTGIGTEFLIAEVDNLKRKIIDCKTSMWKV